VSNLLVYYNAYEVTMVIRIEAPPGNISREATCPDTGNFVGLQEGKRTTNSR